MAPWTREGARRSARPDFVRAEEIAAALGGRRAGHSWIARCPAHDDRTPSLSIRDADGKVLLRCHAGCEQRDVIAVLRAHGLWGAEGHRLFSSAARRTHAGHGTDRNAARLREAALAIWRSAVPARGTLAERYLAARGIFSPPPDALRFHARLRHPSGGVWAAMVALVVDGASGTQLGIHRTFLADDGTGKAPVEPQKMMLGSCRGGVVRLGNPERGEWLAIAEGIETALSFQAATGIPAWAALSASGMRAVRLPREIGLVMLCPDNDRSGVGQAAARDAAERFLREGRRVKLAIPPEEGLDFNDVLQGAPHHAA